MVQSSFWSRQGAGRFFRRVARFTRIYGFVPSSRRSSAGGTSCLSRNELYAFERVQYSLLAEEESEEFLNHRSEAKARWRDLVVRTTNDPALGDRIYKEMHNAEIDAKIAARG